MNYLNILKDNTCLHYAYAMGVWLHSSIFSPESLNAHSQENIN